MYKRKTYIINKEFQYGFIATFLVIIVCTLLIFSGGFILFSYIRDTVGDNAFQEFYTRSYEQLVRIQPLVKDNFVKPLEFAVALKSSQDPVSTYLRENLPVKTILQIDYTDPGIDEFHLQQELVKALNFFLQNTIKNYPAMESFYTKDRFKGIALGDLEQRLQSKIDPQSAAMYELNLLLLARAYPQDLKIDVDKDSARLIEFRFQKIDNPKKLFEISLMPIVINNLLLMVVIIVIGIFYSHRIAGPLYRIEKDISRVLGGEAGVQIKLRKKDKLQPIAEQINRLIDELAKARDK